MPKHIWMGLIAALAALILVGCAREAADVAFADACDPVYEDQYISTVGYFAAESSVYCSNTGGDYRCGLDFFDAPGSANRLTADVLEGNGRNQMAQLPDSYTDADLQIKADDGTVIGVGQRVRITGEMLIGEGVCLMSVDKIEAVTE